MYKTVHIQAMRRQYIQISENSFGKIYPTHVENGPR